MNVSMTESSIPDCASRTISVVQGASRTLDGGSCLGNGFSSVTAGAGAGPGITGGDDFGSFSAMMADDHAIVRVKPTIEVSDRHAFIMMSNRLPV